jgi:hypothetical protein
VSGGALGTPSSGTVTNLTGTASININGTVGATTAAAGNFTTLSTNNTATFNGSIGGTTGSGSNTVSFTATAINPTANYMSILAPNLTGQVGIGLGKSISSGNSGFIHWDAANTRLTLETYGSASPIYLNGSSTSVNGALSATGKISSNLSTGAQFGVGGASSGQTVGYLHAYDTTTTTLLVFDRSDGAVAGSLIYDGSGLIRFGTTTAHNLELMRGGDTIAAISSTGLAVTGTLSSTKASTLCSTSGTLTVGSNTATAGGIIINTLGTVGNMAYLNFKSAGTQCALFGLTGAALGTTATDALIFAETGKTINLWPNGGTTGVIINTSGNVGIGVTPSAWGGAWKSLQFGAFGSVVAHTSVGAVRMGSNVYDNGTSEIYIGSTYASKYEQYESQHKWYTAASGTAGNAISFAQRMTLDSSGNLLVNSTTNDQWYTSTNAGFTLNSSNFLAIARSDGSVFIANRLTNDGDIVEFKRSGSGVGSISVTTLLTSYNTTSDYRRKFNVKDLTGSGTFIDALKPRTFDWDTGDKGVGFIAHEFAEVSPSSVTGEKDAVDSDGKPVYQAMQASSAEVIANLVAELQSLRRRNADIESRLATLETR